MFALVYLLPQVCWDLRYHCVPQCIYANIEFKTYRYSLHTIEVGATLEKQPPVCIYYCPRERS